MERADFPDDDGRAPYDEVLASADAERRTSQLEDESV